MQQLFYSLALLACPIGMGLMMWMMMRGQHTNSAAATTGSDRPDDLRQVAQLRAEIEQLKAERAQDAH